MFSIGVGNEQAIRYKWYENVMKAVKFKIIYFNVIYESQMHVI